MFNSVLTRIFGSRNERVLRQLGKSVAKINALEPQFQALSDDELRGKTDEFKKRLADGATLDSLLPEAFATVREAARRVLGLRPYDVQLIGGMVLHMGRIAEMRTGEGKTLVATLPVYLNALEGKGVHVVTVNDYLAKRDAASMGRVYNFLGLTVGVVWPGMEHADKRGAYAADITYGTNNEFGFDYLRDNMALSKDQRYQRGLNFAIVDEVDSILIDEARTPLIISGPSDESPQLYVKVNRIVPRLTRQESEPKMGEPALPATTTSTRSRSRCTCPKRAWNTPSRNCAPKASSVRTKGFTIRSTSRSCITSTRRCAPTRSTSVTSTTSCATAKSSSSTNSPAARSPAAVGRKACTRPSKRRKACRSSARTRRSPRSPSRTCSACTRSWPA
jgi:hypothetical protein